MLLETGTCAMLPERATIPHCEYEQRGTGLFQLDKGSYVVSLSSSSISRR